MHKLPLAVALLCALPLFAADDVVSLYNAWDSPTLGASKSVENVAFTNGRLKLTLTQGSAAPVLAGEETIGVFFKGKGQLEYVSDDPVEAAVLAHNVRRTKLKPEKAANGLVVREPFEELFLRAGGRELPALTGAAGADLSAAFAEHQSTFDDHQSTPRLFDLLKQKLDAVAKPVVRAEIRGREFLVYGYDAIDARRERLDVLQRIPGMPVKDLKQSLFPIEVSSLPIGVSRKDFQEPLYILVNLQYTATADDEDASIHVVETLVPRTTAQRVFRFQQWMSFYDNNHKLHRFKVRKVTTEDGKPVPFVHDSHQLLVSLPAAMPADKPFKLVFDIGGDFLIRPGGSSFWLLGTTEWFPQPDLNGQYYRVQSTVKVKKPYVPMLPGDTVRRVEEGDYNVLETKIDKPVQFTVALAGKYQFEEETRNDLTIRVASYAGKNTRAMKELTNLAFNMIALYEKFLGPFPFKEFNIIEIDSYGWGQSPPGIMFITKEAFNPTMGFTNRLFSQGVNHMFAHEIAHQYWGTVVKMSTFEEQWLNEAFAEYSAAVLMKAAKGENLLTPTWRGNAGEAARTSSIVTANQLTDLLNPDDAFRMRTYLIYHKGAYLLSRLHEELGEQKFLTFLRTVQGKYAWRFASTKDVIGVLNAVAGKDYTQWFEEHYWGTGMPK